MHGPHHGKEKWAHHHNMTPSANEPNKDSARGLDIPGVSVQASTVGISEVVSPYFVDR